MKSDKKTLRSALFGLLLGGALMYTGYLVGSAIGNKQTLDRFLPDTAAGSLFFFASVVVAPLVAIALHELGHLVAGLLQGFRTELFVVGFLGIKRAGNRLAVYFNTDWQHFGGVAATVPRKLLTEKQLINAYKRILISGPLASLLVAVVSLAIAGLTDSVLNPFLGLAGMTSVGIFLATTLPSKTGVFFTDRKRFQRLASKGQTGRIELAFLQIVNQSIVEGSCKNLPLDKLDLIKTDPDAVIRFWGEVFQYQFYKDNQNAEGVAQAKEKLLAYQNQIPAGIWKSLQLD
jgi:hypothetical protein